MSELAKVTFVEGDSMYSQEMNDSEWICECGRGFTVVINGDVPTQLQCEACMSVSRLEV